MQRIKSPSAVQSLEYAESRNVVQKLLLLFMFPKETDTLIENEMFISENRSAPVSQCKAIVPGLSKGVEIA